jgi:hypothetical protein
MNDVQSYFLEELGISLIIGKPDKERIQNLPLYIAGNYNFSTTKIHRSDILLAETKDEPVDTRQIIKQAEFIKNEFNFIVVFVLHELQSGQRRKLIEKKIAFIQPWKQVYIPELVLMMNDMTKTETVIFDQAKKLSFLSQYVLLYHLQIESLENKSGAEISRMIGYSKMSMSRVSKELQSSLVIELDEKGREKIFHFTMSPRILWSNFSKVLSNPVRERLYFDKIDSNKLMLRSGEEALSEYSNLSAGDYHTLAISKTGLNEWKHHPVKLFFSRDPGSLILEVWHYDPVVPEGSRTVDKLSLYLSLRESPDERIRIALDEMIHEIEWSKDWKDSKNILAGTKIGLS